MTSGIHGLGLILDEDGFAHIAHYDEDGNPQYTTNASGAWMSEAVY